MIVPLKVFKSVTLTKSWPHKLLIFLDLPVCRNDENGRFFDFLRVHQYGTEKPEKSYVGIYYRKGSAFVKQVLNRGHFLLFCTGPWIDMIPDVW